MAGMKDKLNIFPSRGNYMLVKAKLKGAEQGYHLLDTKVEALEMRFRKACKDLVKVRGDVNAIADEAFFSMAECRFRLPSIDIKSMVLNDVSDKAQITSTHKTENVAGVWLPRFLKEDNKHDHHQWLGLSQGGQSIEEVKRKYRELLDILFELVTMEIAFKQLDGVISSTKRRVNALHHVIVPRFENTVQYIVSELDELEREDFYRIKMLQNKKKRAADKKEADRQATEHAKGDHAPPPSPRDLSLEPPCPPAKCAATPCAATTCEDKTQLPPPAAAPPAEEQQPSEPEQLPGEESELKKRPMAKTGSDKQPLSTSPSTEAALMPSDAKPPPPKSAQPPSGQSNPPPSPQKRTLRRCERARERGGEPPCRSSAPVSDTGSADHDQEHRPRGDPHSDDTTTAPATRPVSDSPKRDSAS